MQPSEEINHRRHCDALVVTPPPFAVLEYLVQNNIWFTFGRFCRMQTTGNELWVGSRLSERGYMALPELAKHWNHRGDCRAFSCRCIG